MVCLWVIFGQNVVRKFRSLQHQGQSDGSKYLCLFILHVLKLSAFFYQNLVCVCIITTPVPSSLSVTACLKHTCLDRPVCSAEQLVASAYVHYHPPYSQCTALPSLRRSDSIFNLSSTSFPVCSNVWSAFLLCVSRTYFPPPPHPRSAHLISGLIYRQQEWWASAPALGMIDSLRLVKSKNSHKHANCLTLAGQNTEKITKARLLWMKERVMSPCSQVFGMPSVNTLAHYSRK